LKEMKPTVIYPWQQAIWRQIRQQDALRTHAILLKGRAGIGKLAWARTLAKAMLCERVDSARMACGDCSGCRWFEQGQHPNFRLLEPEAFSEVGGISENEFQESKVEVGESKSRKKPSHHIGITQVRALDDFIYLSAHQNRYKLVLIHPAEALNTAAANALLKKLEEPPPNVLFILVAHRASAIPATILSRCQQIAMPVPNQKLAKDWLIQQGVENPDFRLAMTGFAPLLALQYENDYLAHHVDFIRYLCTPGEFDPIELAEKLYKLDLPSIVSWLQKWCYDLMSCCTTGRVRYHIRQEAVIKKLAETVDPISVAFLWRDLIASQQLSRHPLNSKLFVEEMLFSYIQSVAAEGGGN